MDEYDAIIDSMKKHKLVVEAWLNNRPPQDWSNAHFPAKCCQTTTCVSDSCNNVLKGKRGITITTLVKHRIQRMASWINNRRNITNIWHSHLTSYAIAYLTKIKKFCAQYVVQLDDLYVY